MSARTKNNILLTALLGCSVLCSPAVAQQMRAEGNKKTLEIPKVLLPPKTQAVDTTVEDNLGNSIADRTLKLEGKMILNMQTDVDDMGSSVNMGTLLDYQTRARLDNLGDHIATMPLDMQTNKIVYLANAYNGDDGDAVNVWTLKKYLGDIQPDNLGNHVATKDLLMNSKDILMGPLLGYDGATGQPMVGPGVVISKTFVRGLVAPAQGSDAANKDYVDASIATIDLSGAVFTTKDQTIDGSKTFVKPIVANAGVNVSDKKIIRLADPTAAQDGVNLRTLQNAIAGVKGDNLGDHKATQTLNANNNLIDNVNVINIVNKNARTVRFLDENGVMKGRVQHNASQNMIHLSLLDPSQTSLGSATLSTNGGFYAWGGAWLNANMLKFTMLADPTDPMDGVNLRTLQAFIAAHNGDNLGNHLATQTLDMNGNSIADARVISITNKNTQALQFLEEGSKIENAAIYRSAQGTGSLRLQLRDSAGNITGAVSLSSDGGFYPWGTAFFNANLRKMVQVDDPTQDLDAVNLRTLRGQLPTVITDNLGNHTATTNVSLANFKVSNVATPTAGQDLINLITMKNALPASTTKVDNLGNHKATQVLSMTDHKVVRVNDPSNPADGVNLRTLQAAIAAIKGDNLGNHTATMDVNAGNNKTVNLADPTDPQDFINLRTLQNAFTGLGDNLGDHTATTAINMANFKVINVATPTAGGDATNKTYVDDLFASGLRYSAGDGITFGTPVSGSTPISVNSTVIRTSSVNQSMADIKTFTNKISANNGITTNNKKIEMVADPTAVQDLVNLRTLQAKVVSVGDNLGNHTATQNINMSNNKVINVAAPTADGDITNKTYVDNLFASSAKYSAADGVLFGTPVNGVTPVSVNVSVVRTAGNQSVAGAKTFTSKITTNAGMTLSDEKIEMVADATAAQDVVNLRTLQAAITNTKDNLGDHTAIRNLNLANFKITNMGTPTVGADLTTKTYVDNMFANVRKYLAGDGLTLTGQTFSANSTIVRTSGNQDVGGVKTFTDGSINVMGSASNNLTFRTTAGVAQAQLYVPTDETALNLRMLNGASTASQLMLNNNGLITPSIGRFDGANKVISTVADPVSGQDVVNLRTMNDAITNAGDNLGNHVATQNINVANNRVINVGNPTSGGDITTKTYVDNTFGALGKYSASDGITFGTPVSGVTPISVNSTVVRVTGNQSLAGVKTFSSKITAAAGVTLNNQKAESLANPTAPQDGVNLRTMQSAIDGAKDNLGNHTVTRNINVSNFKVVNVASPTAGGDVTNKTYVDNLFRSGPSYSAGDGLSLSGSTFLVNSTVVRTSGNQNVGGVKNFTSAVVISGNANNVLYMRNAGGLTRSLVYASSSDGSTRIRNYAANGTTSVSELGIMVNGRILPVTGKFDANNRVISTVADPVSTQDVVNLRSLRGYITAGTGIDFNSTTGALSIDETAVRTTGDQTIRGVKSFTTQMNVGGTKMTSNRFETDESFGFAMGGDIRGYGDQAGQTINGQTGLWMGSTLTRHESNIEGIAPFMSPRVQFRIQRPAGSTATHPNDTGGEGLIMTLTYRTVRIFRALEVNGTFYQNDPTSLFNAYVSETRFDTGDFKVSSQGNNITLDTRRNRTDIPGSGGIVKVFGRAEATGGFHTSSDATLKKNINPITQDEGMEIVRRIEPVTYDLREDDKHAAGVVAQQLREVMPYAVNTGKDGKLSVEYVQMIAPMAAALNSLNQRIATLEAN